ncbi:DcrB-related protein [Halarsenatibacter silvermanii]|uniref:Uncharacterized protein n=1 Tax=Halarsenatibacter silvermanii TaxID=321763 RepID=A0A1G9L274_9FIRM|nr:DcrB-related protein [Halarsenatibacter silvermanii]SDL55944.1 hypothetical protein SAMN04488692_105161 [Halarsenatibacter silvermanii]
MNRYRIKNIILKNLTARSQILVLFLLLFFLSAASIYNIPIEARSSYNGDNFSMDIPSSWELIDQDIGEQIEEFIYLAPEEIDPGEIEGYRHTASVNVAVERLAAEFTAEEYADIIIKDVESRIDDFELIARENVELAGEAGIKVRYRGQMNDDESLVWQEWMIVENDEQAITLTYTAVEQLFDDYYGEVQSIADSLKIEN